MMDARKLVEEIAELDKMIESYEAAVREARQHRELKIALLRQLEDRGEMPLESVQASQ